MSDRHSDETIHPQPVPHSDAAPQGSADSLYREGDSQSSASQPQTQAQSPHQRAQAMIARSAGNDFALAREITATRAMQDRELWTALQSLLGNQRAMKVLSIVANPGAESSVEHNYVTSEVIQAPMVEEVCGVTVTVSTGCHPEAMAKVAEVIRQLIGRNLEAQRQMKEKQIAFVVIPAATQMTDLPEFASLTGKQTFDGRPWEKVRGNGGTPTSDGKTAVAIGEEQLIEIKGFLSHYGEPIGIAQHEFAHALHLQAMTPEQQARVTQLYAARRAAATTNEGQTWSDDYASKNEQEYFAQCSQAFFGTNERPGAGNGRDWLAANDPEMLAFLTELYERDHPVASETTPARRGR